MAKVKNKKEKIREKKFNKVAKTIFEYMEERDWFVLVLCEPSIIKNPNSHKYNFSLNFDFTGRKDNKK